MNTNQRILTGAALLVFLISIWFAPWEMKTTMGDKQATFERYSPLWSPPKQAFVEDHSILRWQSLCSTWTAIGVIWVALFFLLADRRKQS